MLEFGIRLCQWHAHLARDSRAGRAPQRGCPAGDPARPCHNQLLELLLELIELLTQAFDFRGESLNPVFKTDDSLGVC